MFELISQILLVTIAVGLVTVGILAILIWIRNLTRKMSILRLFVQIVATIAIFVILLFWPLPWNPILSGLIFSIALRLTIVFVLIVASTLVIGRFFCGWLCPFTLYMDLLTRLRKAIKISYWNISERLNNGLNILRYVILAVILILALVLGPLNPEVWRFIIMFMGPFKSLIEFLQDLSEFDPQKTHSLDEYIQKFGDGYLAGTLERYWIHMGGRALELFRPVLAIKPLEQIIDESSDNCAPELTDTNHYHIDLFGNYIPGLCAGLAVAAQDLGQPLARERYPLLTTLFNAGIKGLLRDAQKFYGFTAVQNGYINKCDLCTEIRTFLVKHNFNQSQELNPREFYRLR